ncbi:MAG: 16S rRNA methyltransferase [Hyphomicrobiales bacterium]|nr:16S rRNA methyltransferase [Hyphomicrobiales bacterium]
MSETGAKPQAAPPAPKLIDQLQSGVPPALAMLAGLKLDVFSELSGGPRETKEIASALGVEPSRLTRLLYALVAAGLIERHDKGFANSPEAATYFVKRSPRYIGGMHELLEELWRADLETAQSIRSGHPAALHDFSAMSDDEFSAMLRGMHPLAMAAGRDLAERFDFSSLHSVVDVGGGSGGLIATLCELNPGMNGLLFELPGAARLAEPLLRATPGGDRVAIETGDILRASPSGSHDAAILRAFIQVLAPEDAANAIAHVAAALRPGGTIYIAGSGILDDTRLSPAASVYRNLTFMNLYRSGASYTESEHARWLEAAGCGDMQRITLPNGGGVIRATKRLTSDGVNEEQG